ncbi:MAG: hypothetical protein ACJ8C3_00370 [Microvirga sp.]
MKIVTPALLLTGALALTACNQTASSFMGILCLAAALDWLKT